MSDAFEQACIAFGFEDYTEKGREQLRDAIIAFLVVGVSDPSMAQFHGVQTAVVGNLKRMAQGGQGE